nr:TPA_asm: m05.5 sORF [Murid betaherpesvirus 1]DBA07920.1 TPA_asm: m05.5 sORF [Murid betaherpesvirus 1]
MAGVNQVVPFPRTHSMRHEAFA